MSAALTKFSEQLALVDQLISIHGKLQSGRGRRHEQDAIHRAGVVLTVAAWQAYNEKILLEALDAIAANLQNAAAPAPSWALQSFNLRRAQVSTAVKKFNTPDDVRTRDLFQESLGFNPWPSWEWRQGRRQWDAQEVRNRTNTWVLVRHSIAHGFELPTNVVWLRGQNGTARLTLGLLKECRAHFVHLTSKIDASFSDYLVSEYGVPRPW